MPKTKQRKPNRLKGYDYSAVGAYSVTVCADKRECLFGEIKDGKMILNAYGKIADKYWDEIPEHFKNIELDEYIVMPNHVHGIVIVDNDSVENRHACSLHHQKRQRQTIPVVIGSYKSAVTRNINQIKQMGFRWQKSFYDHVIHDERDLNRIREYIVNNPANWGRDEENPAKHW